MNIINPGKTTRKGEFYFKCRNCGCEWYADRGEVKISPPCVEFYTYMKCPNCRAVCYDR